MSQTIYDYYTLLPDPAGEHLLLLDTGNGWSLPHFTRDEQHFWQSTEHINAAMRDLLGVDVTTLRCVWTGSDEATSIPTSVYALDNHGPRQQLSANTLWVGESDWQALPLANPSHARFLQAWFADQHAPPHPLRVPWAVRGWFREAASWVRQQLERHALVQIAPVEQVRAWERSCVLRVRTDTGDLYFKALPPMFAFEIRLVEWLQSRYPGSFPNFLSVDHDRLWTLMPDFGGPLVSETTDISIWQDAARRYASIQADLSSHTDHLLSLGVSDMRLERLEGWIDGLMSDEALLTAGDGWLSQDDIAALRDLAPTFKEMCAELTSFNIPQTLEHGDFWPQNIVRRDQDYLFFDWSDSSVTHPFFSMHLYSSDELELPAVPDIAGRLRDAYLEPWSAYASRANLLRAYDLAQTLAPVHLALIYQRNILPNMEHKWEMENMAPYFLKKLLIKLGVRD